MLKIPKFRVCHKMFLQEGWGPFLHLFQGHDDEISLIFSKGFDGKMDRVGSIVFPVTEESIQVAKKLPQKGARWHKHIFLPQSTFYFPSSHIITMFHTPWDSTDSGLNQSVRTP